MAAVQSLISVESVAIQSKLSVISVGANSVLSTNTEVKNSVTQTTTSSTTHSTPPPTTKAAPTHTTAPSTTHTTNTTHKVKSVSSSSTTHSAKATHTTAAASAKSGGISGGAVAAIVIVILLVAAGAGFLFWRRRKQQQSRMRSGAWLENGGYSGSKGEADSGNARQTTYSFTGTGNNVSSTEARPYSLALAPPPPPKEKGPETPTSSTALLSPSAPSRAHSPRPRTPELPAADPYTEVQNALAQHQNARPDSGPMLLYSTPRQDDYFGAKQPSVARQLSVASAHTVQGASTSSFADPNVSSMRDAPPMPVPVPAPVPAPASPTPQSYFAAPVPQAMPTPSPSSPPPPAYAFPAPPQAASQMTGPSTPTPPVVISTDEKRKVCPVVRTYVPTLLDELRVSVGDRVVIINEFDDGWAYCEKVDDPDGAAGVVPLECLDRNGSAVPRALSPTASFASSATHLSARFSSFHVDFDAIRASQVQ